MILAHPRADMTILMRLRTIGWAVVEAAFLLIALCVLLNIILGGEADSFIAGVPKNATDFLQRLPPGIVLGIALIVMIHGWIRSRLQR
jgi:hypothetical protein